MELHPTRELGFTLTFSKSYSWAASSYSDRAELLTSLHHLCKETLSVMPKTSINFASLYNVPQEKEVAQKSSSSAGTTVSTEDEEYMVTLVGNDFSDIDGLYLRLSSRLTRLESNNVKGLIESEGPTSNLLAKMSATEGQIKGLNDMLLGYGSRLKSMRQMLEHIESKNNRLEVMFTNQKSLLSELQNLVASVYLSGRDKEALEKGDLGNPALLPKIAASAAQLTSVINASLSSDSSKMDAVRGEIERSQRMQAEFSRRLATFLTDHISKLESQYLQQEQRPAKGKSGLTFTGSTFVVALQPYADLLKWLRPASEEQHHSIVQQYVKSAAHMYHKDVKHFFEQLVELIVKEPKEYRDRMEAVLFSSSSSKLRIGSLPSPAKPLYSVVEVPQGKYRADSAFSLAMRSVMAAARSEHDFCCATFGWSVDADGEVISAALHELFEGAPAYLENLVEVLVKADPFYLFAALLDIAQYESSPCGFVVSTCNRLHQLCKIHVSRFMDSQVDQIQATQIAVRAYGVVPHIVRFLAFVDYVEGSGAERASERVAPNDLQGALDALDAVIDPAYHKLVGGIFMWLNGLRDLEKENRRKKKSVYVLRIENYHFFIETMGPKCNKVRCLEPHVQEARTQLDDNLQSFCQFLIRAKFRKLVEFFDDVSALLQSGLPPQEVPFQVAHSKQACLHVVGKFRASRVERALGQVHKSLRRNVSSDSPDIILPLIWRHIKDTLIPQLNNIENLLQQCYGGAVSLPLRPKQVEAVFYGLCAT
eukprot:TRINITY_DN5507_c0_g1_i2.p1 TRINITY_DN5507_c0_g1~~TRINITY_DN5507_c0_g1_i2.p1  ORF type:complete len:862 (-),score=220.17 TRINITY_DN5507_c0_g1_i2:118-2409(-)